MGANFNGAKFVKDVHFRKTHFYGANFDSATFERLANFDESIFWEESVEKVSFERVMFLGVASFKNATFLIHAHFKGGTFSQVHFFATAFEQGANFSEAEFKDRALFVPMSAKRVILKPNTYFLYTNFLGEVKFDYVDLSGCSFLYSNICKVDLRYCKFENNYVPLGCLHYLEKILKHIRSNNIKRLLCWPFLRKNVLWDEIDTDKEITKPYRMLTREASYEPVRCLYLELKRNFEERKDWDTAGDFHYGEMECRRKKINRWCIRNIFSWEAPYYWLSGYGERPLWSLGVLLSLVLLIFPLLYYISGDGCFFQSMWNSLMVTTFGKIAKPDIAGYLGQIFWLLEIIVVPTQFALLALAVRRKTKR